jgi:guanylate kinase
MPGAAAFGPEPWVMARGRLFVLSGPSGAGKTALMTRLRAREPDVHFAITATTRAPRPGEQHGVDYYFCTEQEFRQLLDWGGFVEHARIPPPDGCLYGTPRTEVTEPIQHGKDGFVQVDVQGARSIREIVPDAVLIFLKPPDVATLRSRLIGRGTEATPEMERRLENALLELASEPEFRYVVVNADGQLDAAIEQVREIMRVERSRGHQERGSDAGNGAG